MPYTETEKEVVSLKTRKHAVKLGENGAGRRLLENLPELEEDIGLGVGKGFRNVEQLSINPIEDGFSNLKNCRCSPFG